MYTNANTRNNIIRYRFSCQIKKNIYISFSLSHLVNIFNIIFRKYKSLFHISHSIIYAIYIYVRGNSKKVQKYNKTLINSKHLTIFR